jgi:hypothetical protein
MPPKKSREQAKQVNTYILLRDKKTYRHHVTERGHLLFSKTDSLKARTFAKYDGLGVSSSVFEGTVIMSGTYHVLSSS